MKIKLGKFIEDPEMGQDDCQCCNDDMNGIFYGSIKINNLIIRIHLCWDCLQKLRRIK